MTTQRQKGDAFRALHTHPEVFIMPNAWDAGSARLLELAGFAALATTSAGFAFSIAKQDNAVGREGILLNAAAIVATTDLPVSADLENGFGATPAMVAETIRLAASVGLVGGSIEDASYDAADPLFAIEQAAERVRAAAEAAHAQPFPFLLTARAEGFLAGRSDLGDVIARLQAYQEAGADVLYAPGLTDAADVRTVIRSIDRPLNVLVGLGATSFSRADLGALGVRRISVGSAPARHAYGALLEAAREMHERGTFEFVRQAAPYAALNGMFAR